MPGEGGPGYLASSERSNLREQAGVNPGSYKTVYTPTISEAGQPSIFMNQEMFLLSSQLTHTGSQSILYI